MKLKAKPKLPTRNTYVEIRGIDRHFGQSLEEIKEYFTGIGVDSRKVRIEMEYGIPHIEYDTEEDEILFQERMKSYKKQLAEYEKWYEFNKEDIEKELLKRKKKREENKRMRNNIYKKNLQSEIDRKRAELMKLEAKLG